MDTGSDGEALFFTARAQRAYPVGDLSVVVSNFATLADAEHVSSADNAAVDRTRSSMSLVATAYPCRRNSPMVAGGPWCSFYRGVIAMDEWCRRVEHVDSEQAVPTDR